MIAFVLLVCVITVAAQVAPKHLPTLPPNLSMDELRTQPGNHSNQVSHFKSDAQAQTGWWFIGHIQYCLFYTQNSYEYLMVMTDNSGYFVTNDVGTQQLLNPGCYAGNYVGFYIIDNQCDWSQVFTFNYK